MPHSLVDGYQCLREHLWDRQELFGSEHRGSRFHQNVSTYLLNYIMLNPRRL